jgi:hypothetical protein
MTFTEFLQSSIAYHLWSMSEKIDDIHGMLQSLTANEATMAQTVQTTAQDILDKIAEVKDRTDAENALLDEIRQMLVDAQAAGDPAKMQQAIDMLDEIRQGAVDAITRNTPDAGTSGGTSAVTTGDTDTATDTSGTGAGTATP